MDRLQIGKASLIMKHRGGRVDAFRAAWLCSS